ncbi:MAG: FHA domain-containing protein, partial [Persicimonas sp.]
MPDPSNSNIQDLTDAVDVVDEPSDFPFRIASEPADAVVSSLDGRPELIETAGELTRLVTSGAPGAMSEPATAGVENGAGPIPMLVIQSPGGTMETRRPVDTRRFLIGTESCDLELEDGFVSRWHAQLFERDGALVLQDLASQNGVYLRIADDLALEDGDQIVIGEQRFEFRTSFDQSEDARADLPAQLGAAWV